MKVALTGATGFVGSHVLTELQGHGHDVMALVRDDAQAEAVTRGGATPTVVDLYDRAAVAGLFGSEKGPSTRPAPVTLPVPTWTTPSSTRLSMPSPARASPISRSAASGSTGPTVPSPSSRRSMPRRWWPGRSLSNATCWVRQACEGWWWCPALLMVTAGWDPRGSFRVSPRRRRQPDNAGHGPTALVDRARGRPGRFLPARPGRRLR